MAKSTSRKGFKKQSITAIIYDKRGRILSIGKNSYIKTHPLQAHYAQQAGLEKKIYLHAEIHAIAKCQNLKKAYRILISRFDKEGNPKLAKPCPVCEKAILDVGIKEVEWTI